MPTKYPSNVEVTAIRIHLRSGEIVETSPDEIFTDPPLNTRTPSPGPPGPDGPTLVWLPVMPIAIYVHGGNGNWRRFYGATLELVEKERLIVQARPGLVV